MEFRFVVMVPAALDEAERKRWQQLWVDVESLRQRAGNR
jgi:hypothetical protein